MDKENKNEQTNETERLVKAIRAGVIEIDKTIEENYIAAEKAVDNLVTCQILDDFLRDKENTKKRLQEFLKQVVFISDSCESVTPLWKQEAAKGPNNFAEGTLRVPVLNVPLKEPHNVVMLSPGTPDHFWLRLFDVTIQFVENWMKAFYSSQTCLVSNPDLGSHVIYLSDRKFYRAMVTKVNVSIPAGAPIIEVFLLDYGEIRVTSLNFLFAIDESQPFKYLPATALLCTLDKMQPSPPYFLKSSNFFFGQSTNLTAVFHALCEHESTKLSNVIYPQYHVTLLKTQITSRFSRIFDIRPLLPRSPLTAQNRQNLLHSSMSSVSVAATPPSYRAASRLPTRSRFVPYQNPVMATSALKHRTSSPQITPRPPRITRFRRYFMD